MFDIKSFYEASSVEDAIRALSADPDSLVISGGTDVLIRVREGRPPPFLILPTTRSLRSI